MKNDLQIQATDAATARLRSAQIHYLYSQARFGAVGSVAGAIILTATLWEAVPTLRLVLWLAVYLIVHGWRHVLVARFFSVSPVGEAAISWDVWFQVGAILGTLLWGMTAIYLFPVGSLQHQFILAVCVTGITTAAAVVYAATNCYIPCILVGLLPLSARFLYEGDENLIIGVVILLFGAVLIFVGRGVNTLVKKSLLLQIGTESLVQSLTEQKISAENLNSVLNSHIALREKAEEALQNLLSRQESLVEERTAELQAANRRLLAEIDERERAESELRKTHTALKSSEERFRTIFESAEEYIFIKDNELKYAHANPAMVHAFGFTETDVIGKTDEEVFGPSENDYLKELESRVLTGQAIESEHVVKVGGHVRVFRCSRAPLHDSSGKIVGLCGMGRDITDEMPWKFPARVGIRESNSKVMRATLDKVLQVARTDSIVLFLGESGSGKDYLARYLHENSQRSSGPFFAINCAALPGELAESELFGHEAGAFTGASGRKRGLLELAEGGTLLLNEIGELSLNSQAKLLTFLDTQTFTRIGGQNSVSVNARILAATNRDLAEEEEAGRFRSDLFYRINVFPIKMPSLRDRPEDIPLLAQELLEKLSQKLGRKAPAVLAPTTIELLCSYHWPGNVRELRNILERALILCNERHIRPKHVEIAATRHQESFKNEVSVVLNMSDGSSMKDLIEKAKNGFISQALTRCEGNVSAAARVLGISRDVLRHEIKKLGLGAVKEP